MSTGPENTDRPVDRAPEAPRPGTDGPTPTDPVREPSRSEPTAGRRTAEKPAADSPTPVADGGKTAGLWVSLILGAIVLVLLLIFVIQNSQTASFDYFSATFDLPLGVAMLLAAIAGALVMALVGSVRMFQLSLTIRKLRKQQEKIHRATR